MANAAPPSRRIERFMFGVRRSPLTEPYKLSFTAIENFDSVWVVIEDECGRIGIGEAVPLPGYSHETVQDVLGCMDSIVREKRQRTTDRLREYTLSIKAKYPFAASAVIAAMELPYWLENEITLRSIPLIFPLASILDEEKLLAVLNKALSQSYQYFKLKVGMGLKNDLRSADILLKARPDMEYRVSFDANQAFNPDEASAFCKFLGEKDSLNRSRFVEQPFPTEEWRDVARLCANTPAKIALDESIFEESDISRASEVGCSAIKLKLFKHYGMKRTLELAKKAYDLGLEVIFGNGVSTDIGNLAEALIYSSAPRVFAKGAECNGFIKLQNPVLFPQLRLADGRLTWKTSETSAAAMAESIRTFALNYS